MLLGATQTAVGTKPKGYYKKPYTPSKKGPFAAALKKELIEEKKKKPQKQEKITKTKKKK